MSLGQRTARRESRRDMTPQDGAEAGRKRERTAWAIARQQEVP